MYNQKEVLPVAFVKQDLGKAVNFEADIFANDHLRDKNNKKTKILDEKNNSHRLQLKKTVKQAKTKKVTKGNKTSVRVTKKIQKKNKGRR